MKNNTNKNYLILIVLILVVVFLTFYVGQIIKNYKLNKSDNGPLTNNISEVKKDEIYMSLSETNQIVLYVGYNKNKNIRSFEKNMLKIIRNNNLNEYIMYYNVTDELKNNNYLKTLKNEFPEVNSSINKAPMLIYIKNGTAVEVKNSQNDLITIKDFEYLIDKYQIGK